MFCEVWSSCSSFAEDSSVLVCYAMLIDIVFLFRVKKPSKLHDPEDEWSFEMSVTVYLSAQLNIQEDLNLKVLWFLHETLLFI